VVSKMMILFESFIVPFSSGAQPCAPTAGFVRAGKPSREKLLAQL
jgi:hypothetical protein